MRGTRSACPSNTPETTQAMLLLIFVISVFTLLPLYALFGWLTCMTFGMNAGVHGWLNGLGVALAILITWLPQYTSLRLRCILGALAGLLGVAIAFAYLNHRQTFIREPDFPGFLWASHIAIGFHATGVTMGRYLPPLFRSAGTPTPH